MANTKMTKKDWFKEISAIVEGAEIDEEKREGMKKFINREIELLEKKHSKSGQTKTQKENVVIMETIVSELANMKEPVTISDFQAHSEKMKEYSNQKLSSLLKKLVESGKVVRTTKKKRAYFSLADIEVNIDSE